MQQVRAKKSLGQHFLIDLDVAQRIAATVDDYKQLPLLEVGPGMGVLTQFLLQNGHDLKVVELDGESVDYLNANFPALEGRIIEKDFLKLDLREAMGEGDMVVIGNYPYNISSQILFHVLDYKDQVKCCSGMFQREVAQRIAAGPGSKTYGIVSVLLQAWYDIEYLFTVDENVFDPPPKVKSGVIRLVRNDVEHLDCDERLFKSVVKASFGQRRKTLRNSLRGMIPPESMAQLDEHYGDVFKKRPEQLSVAEFVELTNIIKNLQNK
ncbi:MAG: 16S rRNA (adenine(1518)-N(6)/adenine(1519)-N(6))-dimethyltransferase RsmA [Muribaculaceae bacterium]|nr:16S rRNA (adenine(1518)-N(6)/adenine(1519)-N(6))-dimethyltransferase RsmA [Muribaculaceae bacterium]MBR0025385.1 16S rRNA (adenine(1518)-N(6)/adenine(1519)-N(6))-dimethyltransferase RsmA [Muribaculaceae bacterium]